MFEDAMIKTRIPFKKRIISSLLNIYGRTYKNHLPKQVSLIHHSEWDVLIILDACRYDYFSEEYGKILNGKLIKVWSPASYTSNWLKVVFPGYNDLTYISATPFVNSLGIEVDGYKASVHFKRIVDVWDFGWSKQLDAVPPWSVNEAVLRNIADHMIVHYAQPHGPCIGETKLPYDSTGGTPADWVAEQTTKRSLHKSQIPPDEWLALWIKRGGISLEKLRRAYRDNLKLTLDHIKKLIFELPHKNIIVTSDHGEFLGEYGMFLHPTDIRTPILRQVPWFKARTPHIRKETMTNERKETEEDKEKQELFTKEDEEKVKARLKALGYF